MLILASASPRRRALLRRICPEFSVEASDVDEALAAGPVPPAVAALALRKARAMLRRLRGRAHDVFTGVAVVDAATGREASGTARSRVLMASYPDATIDAYVASGAPLDKAGAYAIQDLGGHLVDGLVGSYTNVMGLPLGVTRRLLAGFGVPVSGAPAP